MTAKSIAETLNLTRISNSALRGSLQAAAKEIETLQSMVAKLRKESDTAGRQLGTKNEIISRLTGELTAVKEEKAAFESSLFRSDKALAELEVEADKLKKELALATRAGDDTSVVARRCLELLKLASPDNRNDAQIRIVYKENGAEYKIYPSVTIYENGGRQGREIFKSLEELEKVIRDHLKERVQFEQSKLANRIAELTSAGVVL